MFASNRPRPGQAANSRAPGSLAPRGFRPPIGNAAPRLGSSSASRPSGLTPRPAGIASRPIGSNVGLQRTLQPAGAPLRMQRPATSGARPSIGGGPQQPLRRLGVGSAGGQHMARPKALLKNGLRTPLGLRPPLSKLLGGKPQMTKRSVPHKRASGGVSAEVKAEEEALWAEAEAAAALCGGKESTSDHLLTGACSSSSPPSKKLVDSNLNSFSSSPFGGSASPFGSSSPFGGGGDDSSPPRAPPSYSPPESASPFGGSEEAGASTPTWVYNADAAAASDDVPGHQCSDTSGACNVQAVLQESKHDDFVHKDAAWSVLNLTRKSAASMDANKLARAIQEEQRTRSALGRCDKSMGQLNVASAAASARAGIVKGASAVRGIERLEQMLETAKANCGIASRRLAKARAACGDLPPGPQLVEANAAVAKAHEFAHNCAKEEERAQRNLTEARKAAAMVRHSDNQAAEREKCQAAHARAVVELQHLRGIAAPITRELEDAVSKKEPIPPNVLFVFATKDLRERLSGSDTKISLAHIGELVRASWVVLLGGAGSDNEAAKPLPLSTLLAALGPDDLHAEEVLLVAQPRGNPNCIRYFSVRSKDAAGIRECAKRTAMVPACLELLRAALSLSQEVQLQKTVRTAVLNAMNPRSCNPPEGLQATLRPYQLKGFQWLATNAENGIGCILADDMGLGKTLQTISLLLHLRQIGRVGVRPALVVAPFSVMSTWERELRKWAPALQLHIYHGSSRSLRGSGKDSFSSADVVLTTYAILQRDVEKFVELGAAGFACVVLDESQAIKNSKSLTAQSAKRLVQDTASSCIRVALSGTPVENRVTELHSLFEFLNPGFFGTRKEFSRLFEKGQKDESDPMLDQALKRLNAAIKPLMLRRLKTDKDIAADLPDKVDLMHTVELTPAQRRLYTAMVEESLEAVTDAGASSAASPTTKEPATDGVALPVDDASSGEEGGVENSRPAGRPPSADSKQVSAKRGRAIKVLATLHGLQQVCNHPAAVLAHRWPGASDPEGVPSNLNPSLPEFSPALLNSGKTARLLEILEEIFAAPREKVLIFTQYVATMDLLAALIEDAFSDVEALKFHGGLSREERDQATSRFADDPKCAVMLLTLQAGGVGLTLTAASHVVHFDRCWNPAKEAQATDRAHRIGQKSTVVVHRLVSAETFEVRLANVVARKRRLADATLSAPVEGQKVLASLSDQELRQLFLLSSSPQERSAPRKRPREPQQQQQCEELD